MGKIYDCISPRLREFIECQRIFFVATAPLAGEGHVNLSPKGLAGSLAVIDEMTLAYLDFGGSGAETIAHLRENGRIVLMWCAFAGPPTVVRVHGRGEAIFRDDPRFATMLDYFAPSVVAQPSLRAIILIHAERISDSCGFAVPYFDYREERSLHQDYFGRKSDPEFSEYCAKKEHVAVSLDGLPGLPLPLPPLPATSADGAPHIERVRG